MSHPRGSVPGAPSEPPGSPTSPAASAAPRTVPPTAGRSSRLTVLLGILMLCPMIWLYRSDQPIDPRAWHGEPVPASSLSRAAHPIAFVASSTAAADTDDPPQTIDELRLRIQAVLDEHLIPGVGIALVEASGARTAMGVGLAERATQRPVEPDTLFRVGSISKSVVALGVLTLVDRGRVSLDDAIRDLVPDLVMDNQWSDTDPVTLAQVLEHTAGFDDMRFNEYVLPPGAADPSLADVLARNPRSRVSRWRPGTRHAYANPGYTVAGHIIERITGRGFESYLRERVLVPAGMADASFALSPAIEERLAQGYTGSRHQRAVPYRRLWHRPAGELVATPHDMASLLATMLGRGRGDGGPVVSRTAIARMERSETRPFPRLDTGYGLGNHGDTSLAVVTRGHDGGLPGFYSEYRYSVEHGIGFAVLVNSTGDGVVFAAAEIRALCFGYLTRDMDLPAPPAIDVPASDLERYVGRYQLTSPRFQLLGFVERLLLDVRVSLIDGALFLELGGSQPVALVATAPGEFRLPGHSGAIIAFDTSATDAPPTLAFADRHFEPVDSLWTTHRRRVVSFWVWLIDAGFFWNIVWLPGWAILLVRTRSYFPLPRDALPALASATFLVMQRSFAAGSSAGSLGEVGWLSVLFLCASVLFPILAVLALVSSIRGLRRDHEHDAILDELVDRAGYITQIYSDGWQRKLYHVATALACVAMSIYLGYHGIIGLRTWAW